MSDHQMEAKIRKDTEKVKNDVSTLIGDTATQLGRFEENLGQNAIKTRAEIYAWLDQNATQLKEDYNKMASNAKESFTDASNTVMKNVDHQFSNFNAKAEEVVNNVPGGVGEKIAKYPYVAISIAVIFGFLVGSLLSPAKKPMNR